MRQREKRPKIGADSIKTLAGADPIMSEQAAPIFPIHRFKTHRRTITETDIVNFVNLVAMHEPFFIDMEFIKENMSGAHQSRFAPGPMIISYAIGLVSPILLTMIAKVLEGHEVGPFAGMTGIDAQLKGGVFPGDTLHVELEAGIKSVSSRGYTAIDIRHIVKNQHNEVVADFVEHVLYRPPVRE